MSINLDVVIDTPEQSIDMKTGLETLQGVSDATRCIAEAILTDNAPQKLSHKGKVRTSLKRNFKGSYGQIFSIDIYDEKLKSKLKKIGRPTFVELISYFINESLYKDTGDLSSRAQKVVDNLEGTAEDIVNQLRVSSLASIHQISNKFDHDLKIRHRISRDKQSVIASFDAETAKTLEVITSTKEEELLVCITRLNIFTGNGRLQIKGENETVAFGFGIKYQDVAFNAKKIFSKNLNDNNGNKSDSWKYLRISVTPMTLKDGKIVKYIVTRFYND